jgi:hypothetical protein
VRLPLALTWTALSATAICTSSSCGSQHAAPLVSVDGTADDSPSPETDAGVEDAAEACPISHGRGECPPAECSASVDGEIVLFSADAPYCPDGFTIV